jgi:hypothetical protein
VAASQLSQIVPGFLVLRDLLCIRFSFSLHKLTAQVAQVSRDTIDGVYCYASLVAVGFPVQTRNPAFIVTPHYRLQSVYQLFVHEFYVLRAALDEIVGKCAPKTILNVLACSSIGY